MVHGLALCFYVVQVDAFWRMVCGTIQTGRIDPIVNPGALSGHCHTVAGPLTKSINVEYTTQAHRVLQTSILLPLLQATKQRIARRVEYSKTKALTGRRKCITDIATDHTSMRHMMEPSCTTWVEVSIIRI